MTTTESPETPTPENAPVTGAEPDKGYPADTPIADMTIDQQAAYWRAQAQKHEKQWNSVKDKTDAELRKQLSAARKELDTARQATMSETEKAVNAARAEGLSEGSRKAGEKIARAEIRAAAAGRNVNIDALLEGIDPTRFLDDDGEPDTKAITAWVDRIAPAADETKPGRRDLGQGARGGQALPLNGDPLLRDVMSKLGI